MAASLNLEVKTLVSRWKEVLSKADALVVHMFAMSCFTISKTLCYELESLMANFGGVIRILSGKSIVLDGIKCVYPSLK